MIAGKSIGLRRLRAIAFPPAGEAMHALIIEQDAWIALMIEDALADAGCTSFDFAVSGEDAVALAAERCPDLITTDLRLGTSNGIEAVRTICAKHSIPVVFVTTTGWEAPNRSAGLAVVQKPFGANEMKQAVAKAIAQPPPAAW
jgi:CheY-like chemotaxis protein